MFIVSCCDVPYHPLFPSQPALHGGGYNPSPVDLSVQLSPSLNDMSRKLAKLAHEQRSFDLMRADKGEKWSCDPMIFGRVM